MKDPFGLEPSDGDYVSYIKSLQSGKIKNLDPLKIDGSVSNAPAAVRTETRRRAQAASTTVSQAGAVTRADDSETPEERIRRKAAEQNRSHAGRFIGLFSGFLGFALFAIGGATGQSEIVLAGMVVAVLGFRLAAGASSKTRTTSRTTRT